MHCMGADFSIELLRYNVCQPQSLSSPELGSFWIVTPQNVTFCFSYSSKKLKKQTNEHKQTIDGIFWLKMIKNIRLILYIQDKNSKIQLKTNRVK